MFFCVLCYTSDKILRKLTRNRSLDRGKKVSTLNTLGKVRCKLYEIKNWRSVGATISYEDKIKEEVIENREKYKNNNITY